MSKAKVKKVKEEKRGFEAEVAKLLHMMVHSVYSDREIFLRELISNASDACDKLRYEAQTNSELVSGQANSEINITVDGAAKTLTLSDNGIGMDKDDLISNLGTIARSGTAGFAEKLTGDDKKDVQLIGQFGVGFYSVFMVADKVSVISKKAGSDNAHSWVSDGEGSYTIAEADRDTHGTTIMLHMKEDAAEFLERPRLEHIVKTYSDHIALPIKFSEAGKELEEGAEDAALNQGSALWIRPKSEITDEQYSEFYHHVAHAFDEPAYTLHYKAEGTLEYSVLMFIPSQQPMDLFDPARKSNVKLYVKRVFITGETQEILPGWLRFLRGVVDSEDLPLNISREMLQNNPVLNAMKKAVTNKVVSELEKIAKKDSEKFQAIWQNFGPVLKEGIYEDGERREKLLKLSLFHSTHSDDWTTLSDYISRMKEGQDSIYYVTGTDVDTVKRSPQLEGFKARGIEVLLLSDPVDDFWLQTVTEHEGKSFKSVTRSATDLKDLGDAPDKADDAASEGDIVTLITLMKEVLGEGIKDVRTSDRLTETAVCLVADDSGMDMHLERILKAHNQLDMVSQRVLEINPSHKVIKALAENAKAEGALDALADPVKLLLDQALILEGEPLADPTAFAKRLSDAVAKGLV